MDKLAVPLIVVGALVGYALIGEQFKKMKQAAQQPVQMPAAQPVVPPQVFQPFNPFGKQEPPPPADDDFTPVPFSDPNGVFRVSFPARKPDRVSFPLIAEGNRVTRYTVERLGTTFEVGEFESGWDAAGREGTARDWLKRCHRNQLEAMNVGEEVAKELRAGNGIPGLAFTSFYSKDGRPKAWHGRVYLVGSRVYSASVYGDVNLVSFRAPAFLDSFQLSPRITGADPSID